MGRQTYRLITPEKVKRVMDIIELLLDCHPAGWLVLCGRAEWPSDEDAAEMLRLRSGLGEPVHVQGGAEIPEAQRRVEALESARSYMAVLDRYGGAKALVSAVKEYKRHDPQRCEMLRRIGMAGMPGAESLEAVAGECYIDMKTLYKRKREAIEGIAKFVVYPPDDGFELAG